MFCSSPVAFEDGQPTLTFEALQHFWEGKLAKFKEPTRVFVWPDKQLPRGATLKTPKKDIKKAILEDHAGLIKELRPQASRL